jgi:hypothetical protein
VIDSNMAERGGFEPPVELETLRRFSKPLLSTTQPPLLAPCGSYFLQNGNMAAPETPRGRGEFRLEIGQSRPSALELVHVHP